MTRDVHPLLVGQQNGNGEREIKLLTIDTEAEWIPPDYLIKNLLERRQIAIMSADTGSGKSWLAMALATAAATGRPWLGREVFGTRTVVIDEENPAGVVIARFRAMGLTNAQSAAIAYATRQGLAVGSATDTDAVRRLCVDHKADFLIIDTAMAATNIEDVNDNSQVVRLYKALRPLAEDLAMAVIILHHERKMQLGEKRSTGQAMMGARQWAGQAEVHMALTFGDREATDLGDGRRKLRTTLVLDTPKARDDVPPPPELIAITSIKREDGLLLEAQVESEGAVTEQPTAADGMIDKILLVLRARGEPRRRGEIAAALDVDHRNGTFKRALEEGVEEGRLTKPGRGLYEVAEQPSI